MATIWYVSKYVAPPQFARVSSRGFYLLREFSSLGHKAVLITSNSNHLAIAPSFKGRYLKQIIDSVDVYWLSTSKYRSPRSILRIVSWFIFDISFAFSSFRIVPIPSVIIVSSLAPTTILVGLLLKHFFRVPIVFEVRDIWPLVLVESAGYNSWHPLVLFLSFVERLGYNNSDLIVGLMPNLKQHVLSVSPRCLTPVVCVPHGFDSSTQDCQLPLSEVDHFFLANNIFSTFNLCYAGSVGHDNALDVFFEAAELLVGCPSIKFVLIGDGYLLPEYIKKYGSLPNIVFSGRVPKSSVHSILKRMNVLFFSAFKSRVLDYGQSLNKLIDYMLAGRPIIASYSGFQSMINEAGCGVFVDAEDPRPLADAIIGYSQMPADVLDRIGERGRNWVELNRDFPSLALLYLEYLESIGIRRFSFMNC